jgi:hypothetical protein
MIDQGQTYSIKKVGPRIAGNSSHFTLRASPHSLAPLACQPTAAPLFGLSITRQQVCCSLLDLIHPVIGRYSYISILETVEKVRAVEGNHY